jgi:hypothetical protein
MLDSIPKQEAVVTPLDRVDRFRPIGSRQNELRLAFRLHQGRAIQRASDWRP